MKGKVLSVRISEKDLASCVELCNSVHLKPIGMGGYLTKTLGILLENLRQAHKVMNMSESQAHDVLKQTFGDREVGYSCELPDNFANWPDRGFAPPEEPQVPHIDYEQLVNSRPNFGATIKQPKVPNFDTPDEDELANAVRQAMASVRLTSEEAIAARHAMTNDWPAKEDELKFDQDLEEEIRLSAMLEGENLIDKLLITEHRADDTEVKLMNPDLAGPVPTKKEDEDGEG
jgi:hypothetical protein